MPSDSFVVYGNVIKMIEYHHATLATPLIDENEFTLQINNKEVCVIHAERKNHDYRKDAKMIFIIVDIFSEKQKITEKYTKMIKSELIAGTTEITIITKMLPSAHLIKRRAILEDTFGIKIYHYNYSIFKTEIPKHSLVPKHEIVGALDFKKISEQQYLTVTKFPKILETDPVSVWLGIKPGMIVAIYRSSENSGVSIVYRYCIAK